MSEERNVDPADEVMEGAHDMKNAEAQSVASVSKAEDGIKRSPKRKGDKDAKDEPAPQGNGAKSKAAMVNAGYKAMHSMKKEDLETLLDQLGIEEIVEEDEVVEATYDFSDDLEALVENEATLSDEFKAKTAIIFETAIKSKISTEVERLENEYQTRLEEELDTTRSDLVEKVDSYLNYVVEQWMEENKLAVETGLRTEIAEGFMNQLKDLFVESYIDVPESKVDLVDELAESVETLEEKLNEQTGAVLEMTKRLEEYQREAVIAEQSGGLAATEVEKLKSLTTSLDFEDAETFASKVRTVKESYFKKGSVEAQEIVEDAADDTWVDETAETNSAMSSYLNAIKKTSK